MTTLTAADPGAPGIGRNDLSAELSAVLGRTGPGALAVVVRGEAGMGKTTLLGEATAAARESGRQVLAARPAFGERDLPYAGLADLLSAIGLEAIARLPEPQRLALEVALLRSAPTEGSGDWRPVAQGLLEILRGLAESAPVMVIIDDEPWLDQSTARVLGFALRRLGEAPISSVTARRAPDSVPHSLSRYRWLSCSKIQEPAMEGGGF